MTREKSLIKNTLIITIGKVCTQMITFFLLPLYTGVLSVSEYGTVDLLNTLVALLLPIVTFQIEMAVFRELIENRNNKFEKIEIISTSIISVFVHCLIFFLLFAFASSFIKNNYKLFLVINVIASIFNSLFLQIARGFGDNTRYAIASFLSAFFTVISNVLFLVVFKFKVEGMLLGTFMGQCVSSIYMFSSLKLYKYISILNFNMETLKELWKFSLPMIPNQISWWIFSSSDRIIVTSFLGLSATGLLAASSKFSSTLTTVYSFFGMSFTESIIEHINDEDINVYFNKMFRMVLNLFVSMGIGMIACMPFIYPIMINSKFNDGYKLVPILIVASLFYIIVGMLAVIYVAKRDTKAVSKTSIISSIINIISHLILIKYIGLYAAAISTFLSYFVLAIYRLMDVGDKFFSVKLVKKDFRITILVLIIVMIAYYINNFYLNIVSILITGIFFLKINYKFINNIISVVKSKLVLK